MSEVPHDLAQIGGMMEDRADLKTSQHKIMSGPQYILFCEASLLGFLLQRICGFKYRVKLRNASKFHPNLR